jgi:hypothetical protein
MPDCSLDELAEAAQLALDELLQEEEAGSKTPPRALA